MIGSFGAIAIVGAVYVLEACNWAERRHEMRGVLL